MSTLNFDQDLAGAGHRPLDIEGDDLFRYLQDGFKHQVVLQFFTGPSYSIKSGSCFQDLQDLIRGRLPGVVLVVRQNHRGLGKGLQLVFGDPEVAQIHPEPDTLKESLQGIAGLLRGLAGGGVAQGRIEDASHHCKRVNGRSNFSSQSIPPEMVNMSMSLILNFRLSSSLR